MSDKIHQLTIIDKEKLKDIEMLKISFTNRENELKKNYQNIINGTKEELNCEKQKNIEANSKMR